MSDYQYRKALRVPVARIHRELLDSKLECGEDYNDLDFSYPEAFSYGTPGMFGTAPTEEDYIDYLLEQDMMYGEGEFHRNRSLTEREKVKYRKEFEKIDPQINMDNVRLVEFCWYDGVEAPDCYNEKDPFYEEV